MARSGDEPIANEVVRVGPDLSGFREKLKKDVEKATKGLVFKVKVVADGAGLRDSVRGEVRKQMALSNQPVYKVKVVADATGLKRQIERDLKKLGGLSIGGRGGGGRGDRDAEREARNAEREAKKAEDEHYRRVRTNLEKVEQAEERAMNTRYARARDFQERVAGDELAAYREDVRRKKAADAEKEASIHGVTRAAEKAAAEQTRLAEKAAREQERIDRQSAASRKRTFDELTKSNQFIDYGGKGIKPMNLLYGVVTAMTPALFAMGTSAAQAATSVAALGSAGVGAALGLSGVMVAFQGIGDLLSLRKQVLNEQTTGAANAARDAVRSADDLAVAKRSLADAHRDEATAEQDLHRARREAIRDLEDLKQAVIDLDNQYKSDTLSVAEARETAQATDRNFFASALERARAWQDVRDAETRLKDTTLQRKQKKQDLKESLAGGIEKSERVQQARERVRDARDRRLDAQAALRKQSAGTAAGIDRVSSASAQLKAKIAELSPAAQEMYYWFEKNEGLFKRLQRQISQQVLPGFNTFLQAMTSAPKGGKSTLQIAAEYAGQLGAIIGKYVGKFGEWTKQPLFRSSMARIQERNARAFDKLGQALLVLADPITRILDKASPGFEALADVILKLSIRFADWIEELDKSGGLEKWFKDSRTELGKWWDILVNVGELFRNIFTAAMPAGSSLVTSFRDFTQSLVDWSNSPNGQKQLKDFFQGVRDLPYAKIFDFFKNATTFFVAFRTFKLLSSLNPFMLALGALAASNPEAAAQAFATIADKLAWVMEQIVAHPDAAATLLAIFAAAKLGKAVGFDIKIPVVNSLRDALVSRFKVLDKFVGGGATTGTMNVQAAVVNIYGGGGVDLPGGKGKGRGGVPPVVAGPGGAAKGAGRLAKVGRVLGPVGGALAIYELYFTEWGRQVQANTIAGVAQAVGLARKAFTTENIAKHVRNPVQSIIADIGSLFGLGKAMLAGGGEGGTFERLKVDARAAQHAANDPAVVNRKAVTDYIAARKESVRVAVEEVRASQGVAAAKRLEIAETQRSVETLSTMLQQYGWSKDKADKYSRAIYDLNGLLVKNRQENELAAAALLATGKEVEKTTVKFKALNTEVTSLTGEKKIVLTVEGKKTVIDDLEQVAIYQQLIRTGEPPTESNVRKFKNQFERTKNLAAGGKVPGYSPNDRADNIPAMLTANEWVQPVAAVKHYGTDFMEAVRTRRFPKFAEGGPVPDQWPFKVKMPNAMKAIQPYLYVPPGIGPTGPAFTGKVPKGVGAIRGVNAQLAAAAIDANRAMGAHVSSGLRPGSITRTGNKSYHGFGRAIDLIPPSMGLFNYLKAKYGKYAREIIYTPAGRNQVWRGREHMYTDPRTKADHFNHIHLALRDGGLVQPRKYDRGGILPPGFSTVYNGTGRNETVRTDKQEKALATATTRLDRRDLALLAQYVASATGNPAITMDGRRVAETTNRYNYLPAGV